MPITCSCPSCHRPLRIPDELIGRLVRCPSCQATFPANRPVQPNSPPQTPAPPLLSPTFSQEIQANPGAGTKLPNLLLGSAPAETFSSHPVATNVRLQVQSLVKPPAVALMITVGVCAAMSVVALGMNVFLLVVGNFGEATKDTSQYTTRASQMGYETGRIIGMVSMAAMPLLALAWSAFVFLGAMRMMQFRNYGMALSAAIVAMLPVNCGGSCLCLPWWILASILCLGMGIWATVILCKPEVKAAFQ